MGDYRYLDDQMLTISKLTSAGAERKSLSSWYFDGARRCQRPKAIEMLSRPQIVRGRTVDVDRLAPSEIPLFVDAHVRCRKCEACLRQRRQLWLRRMQSEVVHSQRTWFGTLTLSPDRHYYYHELARRLGEVRLVDIDTLNDEERFAYRCRAIGAEVTRFLKRVRKNGLCHFRYVLVYERHLSGNPHMHLLIHEGHNSPPIKKRLLHACWHDGFSSWKLVQTEATYYVAKYLAKDASTRVRASLLYGQGGLAGGTKVSPLARPDGIASCKTQRDETTPSPTPIQGARSAPGEAGPGLSAPTNGDEE